MGRKLDLSGLTDDETEHVLQVVQRDFNLRKKEEERLSEMKQRLAEENSKCSILSKHQKFVERCCMRCCSPFTFLVNARRRCGECKFSVCKSCCSYQKREKLWVCCVCQQARLLRTQSLEWFYSNVKSRFKRFGSAKVLKNLYRKHRLESGACFDILGGPFEPNLENEGSISGSDSAFYRQSEGHSMMDTLAVALRVAEEAIEEAISKAESHGDSLDKQNEASYLRDHKEELTEELATTILQRIIRKQKNKAEPPAEEEGPEWPRPQSGGVKAEDEGTMAPPGRQRAHTTLWRSQSAFSFTTDDALKTCSAEATPRRSRERGQHLLEESALPGWKSMDGLDGTILAPVLQSPDGNWMALKDDGTRPPSRLLVKPKSGTFQALEVASSVTSAYDEMGSDSEEDFDYSEALSKLCPLPQGRSKQSQSQPAQAQCSGQGPLATSPSNPEAMGSDSETSSSSREAGRRARLSWPQRKAPKTPTAEKTRHQGELDVNFNPQAASGETSDSSDPEEAPHTADRWARRWRRARVGQEEPNRGLSSPSAHPQGLHTPQVSDNVSETDISNEAQNSRTSTDSAEEKLRNRLYELAMKMSETATSSGEDQESEPKTEPETQKESLSCEETSQGVQEELKKVYLAAGTVYGLEGQLSELEDAARCIHSSTGETELADLEDQVAAAAAQVHHAELQISDIESRISALTIAGLNIAPCVRLTRRRHQKQRNQVQTIDTSRQQRRKLPAPPVKAEKIEASSVTPIKAFNRNFLLQGSSENRPSEKQGDTKDVMEPVLESAVIH
ncbi:rab effector MyRIP isoform X3 [Cricetulus griseus]|uniref:Rab effector MyRIP isoform X3 n=1 Tax=Cricetulus griseus TaxID=10029 RepID=A0A9J7K7F4_CRIGR|nr:rab effector MyRIP isoform X3 [Cricetulus griseus]XP_035316121.1 rab effector MyRIP isoform X3 [Cricetulus griseus]